MAVNDRNMSFRRSRAKDLEQLSQILLKEVGGDVTTSVLETVISKLRDKDFIPTLKDGSRDENIWGYDIEGFKIPLETLKHIKPNDIKSGEVYLDMKLRAKIDNWKTFNDPFEELGFNVTIKGTGKQTYFFGFHIDKHIVKKENNEEKVKETDVVSEPHPMYHLQYNLNPTKSKEPKLGDLFYIDTPRIMHKPIDFILGISFLTSNFYPTAFEILKEVRGFRKLHDDYQDAIWKPYFHTLANQWKPFEEGNIVWNPINDICPAFI
jgi:hypothetical protein